MTCLKELMFLSPLTQTDRVTNSWAFNWVHCRGWYYRCFESGHSQNVHTWL